MSTHVLSLVTFVGAMMVAFSGNLWPRQDLASKTHIIMNAFRDCILVFAFFYFWIPFVSLSAMILCSH